MPHDTWLRFKNITGITIIFIAQSGLTSNLTASWPERAQCPEGKATDHGVTVLTVLMQCVDSQQSKLRVTLRVVGEVEVYQLLLDQIHSGTSLWVRQSETRNHEMITLNQYRIFYIMLWIKSYAKHWDKHNHHDHFAEQLWDIDTEGHACDNFLHSLEVAFGVPLYVRIPQESPGHNQRASIVYTCTLWL